MCRGRPNVAKPVPGQLDEIALTFPDLGLRRQLLEVDYSTFPIEDSTAKDSVRGSIAGFIRCRILEIDSPEDFITLRESGEYSREQLNWVRKNILSVNERAALYAIVAEDPKWLANPKSSNIEQKNNVISIESKKRRYGSKKRTKVGSAG